MATLVYLDIFVKSSAAGCSLDFALFCQFQPGVAYNSVAYKKSVSMALRFGKVTGKLKQNILGVVDLKISKIFHTNLYLLRKLFR